MCVTLHIHTYASVKHFHSCFECKNDDLSECMAQIILQQEKCRDLYASFVLVSLTRSVNAFSLSLSISPLLLLLLLLLMMIIRECNAFRVCKSTCAFPLPPHFHTSHLISFPKQQNTFQGKHDRDMQGFVLSLIISNGFLAFKFYDFQMLKSR